MDIFARLEAGVTTASAAETHALAAAFARTLPADVLVTLAGPMGAGKTTFVQGMAQAWKIAGPVTSPTFAVCNLHRGERLLVHVDGYRLSPAEASTLILDDFLVSPWTVVAEWPERFGEALPTADYALALTGGGTEAHTIRLIRSG